MTLISLVLTLATFSTGAHAVIRPMKKGSSDYPASIAHLIQKLSGPCSGLWVGLNPPTLVTAAHCPPTVEFTVKERELDSNGRSINVHRVVTYQAEKVIGSEEGKRQPRDPVEYRLAREKDVAVLIFSNELHERLQIEPEDFFNLNSIDYDIGDEVIFCGWGSMSPLLNYWMGPGNKLNCGKNRVVWGSKKLLDHHYLDVNENPKLNGQLESIFSQIGSTHSSHLLAVGLFDFLGPKDEIAMNPEASLLARGDSGGPWFIAKDGKRVLVGISSFVAADDGEVIQSAFAVSFRSEHVQGILKEAIAQGADIRNF